MTIVVYTAAIRSSSIIPHPPFRFSIFLTGGGFTISKNLKSSNVIPSGSNLTGVKYKGSKIDAYSSMTTHRGSLPHSLSMLPETKIPSTNSTALRIKYAILKGTRKYQIAIPIRQENVAGATGT